MGGIPAAVLRATGRNDPITISNTDNPINRGEQYGGKHKQSDGGSRCCVSALQSLDNRHRTDSRNHRRGAARSGRRQRSGHPHPHCGHDDAHGRDHSFVHDLLGGALRGKHHVDSVQHPGRTLGGSGNLRRLPDGQGRKARQSPRALFSRPRRGGPFRLYHTHLLFTHPRGVRPEVRAGGGLCGDDADFQRLCGARRKITAQDSSGHPVRFYPGAR